MHRFCVELSQMKLLFGAMRLVQLFTFVLWVNADDLIVKSKNGCLKGKYMVSRGGRAFRAFLGIPYAQSPIDHLRFEPPIPASPWLGILDATKVHTVCMQYDSHWNKGIIGSEDCLFLNVFTNWASTDRIRPVMVFIHGGGFTMGSGTSDHYEPHFLLDKDIVLVTFNYRLGALGFLTTGNTEVPGNNGLKDQILALQWVQDNIEVFGGDPGSVTIFGQSAGGASVHFLMLSPLSAGLFHKAISQSGTALCSWASQSLQGGVALSKKLASSLNCTSDEMVDCLRGALANDIIEQQHKLQVKWKRFVPVVEVDHSGAFLSDHPTTLIKQEKVMSVPWVVGLTSDEGAIFVSSFKQLLEDFNKNFRNSPLLSKNVLANITDQVERFYFGNKPALASDTGILDQILSDTLYTSPIDHTVLLHLKYLHQDMFYYLFEYKGSKSMLDVFGNGSYGFGPTHADDLFYLFPLSITTEVPLPDLDEQLSKILVEMFTNFARDGFPRTSSVDIWRPVATTNGEYLHIKDATHFKMRNCMFGDRMRFWRSLRIYENR